jgi:hypothetical protein
MKKNLFLLLAIVAVIFSLSLTSCATQGQNPEKHVTTTVSETKVTGEPNYFLVKKAVTVKKGDAVWRYAKVQYQNGYQWRDIVAQNPILNQPGRVYQNAKGEWIVIIRPGETIYMGGQVVNTTTNYTVDQNSTETEVITQASLLWWQVLGLILFGLFLVAAIVSMIRSWTRTGRCFPCCPSFFRSVCVIDVPRGQNIDQAMHQAEMSENHRLGSNIANALIGKDNLESANMRWGGEDGFSLTTNYHLPTQPRRRV